jgi:hypothetical protein
MARKETRNNLPFCERGSESGADAGELPGADAAQ